MNPFADTEKQLRIIRDHQVLTPSDYMITDPVLIEYYTNLLKSYWHSSKANCSGNPISIERKHFLNLTTSAYLVSLKSDGTRQQLMLTKSPTGEFKAIMIDRNLSMKEVEIWGAADFFEGTLFDGELVWTHKEAERRLLWLGFDCIYIKGMSIKNRKYSDRLQELYNAIADNCDDVHEQMKIIAMNNSHDLSLSPKACVPTSKITELWTSQDKQSHASDGLIFTKEISGVPTGTSVNLFKWKSCHTIDVGMVLNAASPDNIVILAGSDLNENITTRISWEDRHYIVQLKKNSLIRCIQQDYILTASGCVIIECLCAMDEETVHLFPVRKRNDKSTANSIYTIFATLRNMQENIRIEEFYDIFSSAKK